MRDHKAVERDEGLQGSREREIRDNKAVERERETTNHKTVERYERLQGSRYI